MTISDKEVKIPIILNMMYSSPWLEEKAEGDPAGRTNREVQAEARDLFFLGRVNNH